MAGKTDPSDANTGPRPRLPRGEICRSSMIEMERRRKLGVELWSICKLGHVHWGSAGAAGIFFATSHNKGSLNTCSSFAPALLITHTHGEFRVERFVPARLRR